MRATLVLSFLLLGSSALYAQATTNSTESFRGAVMSYDQARQRLVFALPSRELWEHDGQRWGKAQATLPTAASKALYDGRRQRMLFASSAALYSYDGHAVVSHPLPAVLPASSLTTLSVDVHRGRVLALVQQGLLAALAFEWDGVSWQQVASLPQAHVPLSAAYDAARQVTVVSTLSVAPAIAYQTWEWNGTTWSLQHTGGLAPLPLAFDPVRQQVITTSNPTRAWDGTTWTQIAAGPSPTTTNVSTGADPAHGRLWAFSTQVNDEAIWAWDGTAWSVQLAGPHALAGSRATYDSGRGRLVVLGTAHREWDGHTWHDQSLVSGPGQRGGAGQVYDAARGETLVFGGSIAFGGGSMLSGETWAFDGSNWRLAATTGPTARTLAAMTYDSLRARVVLVGGTVGATPLADHWEWDGQTWTQVGAALPNSPAVGALGYDAPRTSLIFTDFTGRTWQHNGSAWSIVVMGAPVPVSSTRALVFDGNRQRLQHNSLGQRYEWDGLQWTSLFADTGELAFDDARGAMLTYTTSALRTASSLPATAADFGSPCGGTTTTTSLTAFGRPRPGDLAFHLDLRAEATLRPAMLGLGLGQANLSLGNGCTLHIQQPLAALVWSTDANGCWHQPLLLPNDLALRGIAFVVQGAVLDPASPGGLALTQGLALAIGD